jgi:hypothetical protein
MLAIGGEDVAALCAHIGEEPASLPPASGAPSGALKGEKRKTVAASSIPSQASRSR